MVQRSEAGPVEGDERARPVDGGWLCLGCNMGSIWQLVVVLEDDLTHRCGAGEGGQQPECLHSKRIKLAGRPGPIVTFFFPNMMSNPFSSGELSEEVGMKGGNITSDDESSFLTRPHLSILQIQAPRWLNSTRTSLLATSTSVHNPSIVVLRRQRRSVAVESG
jgi:hypothetical protein